MAPPIDELRDTIAQRLREVLEEADRLSAALAALDDAPPAPVAAAREGELHATRRARPRRNRGRRAPRGSVRQAVLDALSDGEARTPTEIAALTGQNRATVASTLTRLLAEGALSKPERGYQLPAPPPAANPGAPSSAGDRALQALRSELGAGLRTRAGA